MVQMWQRPTEVLAAMGMSGRNKVQTRYSPEVVLASLESMYEECLSEEA